jgi:hypothetical protein
MLHSCLIWFIYVFIIFIATTSEHPHNYFTPRTLDEVVEPCQLQIKQASLSHLSLVALPSVLLPVVRGRVQRTKRPRGLRIPFFNNRFWEPVKYYKPLLSGNVKRLWPVVQPSRRGVGKVSEHWCAGQLIFIDHGQYGLLGTEVLVCHNEQHH